MLSAFSVFQIFESFEKGYPTGILKVQYVFNIKTGAMSETRPNLTFSERNLSETLLFLHGSLLCLFDPWFIACFPAHHHISSHNHKEHRIVRYVTHLFVSQATPLLY
jgi:hypothetical protein